MAYIIDNSNFIYGKFLEVNSNDATAIFLTDDKINMLSETKSFPVLDSYWVERAKLVLDEKRVWNKKYFESIDAVKHKKDGTTEKIEKGCRPTNIALFVGKQ